MCKTQDDRYIPGNCLTEHQVKTTSLSRKGWYRKREGHILFECIQPGIVGVGVEKQVPETYAQVFIDWLQPVSYTHLDVYKRQALCGG